MILGYLVLLGILWDFPREVAPTDFLLTLSMVEPLTGTQRALVAGVAAGTCTNAPGGDADDFCTTIACPGQGTFRLTVEARTYGTRSETVSFRVLDGTCTQTEGVTVGTGSLASVPTATHCQPPTSPPPPAPVAVETPSQETVSVPVPTPRTTAPVIPRNPNVVPKTPLAPNALVVHITQRVAAAQPTATVPPPKTASVPTGPPVTTMVDPPPVTQPGTPCP